MSVHVNETPTWGVTTSGQPFNDLNTIGTSNVNKISKIVIGHGQVIDSITLTYDRNDGSAPLVQSHGGTGGNITTIELSSDEFLTGVTVSSSDSSTEPQAKCVSQVHFPLVLGLHSSPLTRWSLLLETSPRLALNTYRRCPSSPLAPPLSNGSSLKFLEPAGMSYQWLILLLDLVQVWLGGMNVNDLCNNSTERSVVLEQLLS
ncbi:unnamed protein product [Somion occarium]|uniref:Jacalin-type lectin domain-containing protein n=1 Tax=Somion occarium TaxID=3059160 RepID=A0ABP1DFA8_9APHY